MSEAAAVSMQPQRPQIIMLAASIGHAVWFSHDRGRRWLRPMTPSGGLYNESRAWSLCTSPSRPEELLAGTDQGIYRWRHDQGHWRYLPSPMDGMHVLKLTRSPHDTSLLIAGTRPAEIFISEDDGRSWRAARLPVDSECHFINTPRVTSIQCDPQHADTLWVTVEIAGVFRSRDRGRTWQRLNNGLRDPDVHNLVISDEPGGRRILCSTEVGLHVSLDDGEHWEFQETPEAGELIYFRCMAALPANPQVVFLSIGDRPSGERARLLRSADGGRSWHIVELPGGVSTTIWWIHVCASMPDMVMLTTIFGEIFASENGGLDWWRCGRVLGEVREVAFQPVPQAVIAERPGFP